MKPNLIIYIVNILHRLPPLCDGKSLTLRDANDCDRFFVK